MSSEVRTSPALNFLSGGGEMGELIRAYDWNATSLGHPERWPQPLKTSLRILLSTGHPMFIWWGPDLIQFYNDAYRRSIGPERHPSALGQKGQECWEEIWPIIKPQIDLVLDGQGHTWNENQLVPITRHGKREDVYWTYSYGPIDDPQAPNGVGGVLVVCSETTEQVLAEQRMKAAESRWRTLFDQAPGFMCVLQGPEYRFEYANKNYFEIIGQSDILGKRVIDVVPEVSSQGFIQLLDQVYLSGKTYRGVETPLSIAGAAPIYIDFVYQPIIDEHDKVTGILVDGYNVTKRVKFSQSLREQDRRKDEFLAMLAHELRNPLAPIRNASELLTQATQSNKKLQKIGHILARQVTQLTRLMDDLLDISRISRNRISLTIEPLNVSNAIEMALESLSNTIKLKRHTVNFDATQSTVFINGDLTRIVQCFSNVIGNAVKYTPPGGQIDIKLATEQDSAVITVSDNGCGISQDMLKNVFELFVQAKQTLDRSQGGLGIGLNIVQRLVKMHGGSINVTSEGAGLGSCFTICLPQTVAPSIAADNNSAPAKIVRNILVVDDNKDAADTLAELLTFQAHNVAVAYTAQQALDTVDSFEPEFILLDIGLPDMNGYEVAQCILNKHSDKVLVALTGYGQPSDVARAKDAGFNFHFTKPVMLSDLEDVFNFAETSLEPV